jgi:hypothetical protein
MERRVLYRNSKPLPLEAVFVLLAFVLAIARSIFGPGGSWGAYVFAGALVALGILLGVWRRVLAREPVAVLDAEALTVSVREAGPFSKRQPVVVPWTNIAGASVRHIEGRLTDVRSGYVAVSVRDLDKFLATIPAARRESARRVAERNGAPISIPPVKDLSLDELVALLDSHRDATNPIVASSV